ncbi:MAG: MFS transporter [Proteobacteria bacterium]|nr:MFS transporter [Pseudomonadota bacterium]
MAHYHSEQSGADVEYSQQDEAMFGKISRHLLPLLIVCYVIAYLDRVNIGYAQLQMQEALGFSNEAYALGASIFFVGYFLFEVPSNLMLEKVGARKTLLRIMFGWGIIASGMMYVTTPTMFYLLRFLLGALEAGFFPGIILYLTFWYPGARRAKAIAIFMTGATIAGMIAGPVSGVTMKYLDGFMHHAGWQWLFLTQGLPATLLGVVAFFYLTDKPQQAQWLSADEKDRLREHLSRDAKIVETASHATFWSLIRDPKVYTLSFIFFVQLGAIYVMAFWKPTLIRSWGVDDVLMIGLLAAIPAVVALVGMVLIGRSSDRHLERRRHYAFCAALGVVGMLIAALSSGHIALSIFGLTVVNIGQAAATPILFSAISEYLPKKTAAGGIALISSLGNLGPAVFPVIVAWVSTKAGTSAGLYMMTAMWFICGCTMLLAIPAMRAGTLTSNRN